MKIPNNQDQIAEEINSLHMKGVEAVGDDGSVCVQVKGSKERVWDVAKYIESLSFPNKIGDGIQEGSIFINGDDAGVHDELSEVINLF